MGFYVPCGHALCIHGEDLFLHVLCYRILVLFDELGLVFAVTRIVKRAVYIALGIDMNGKKDVLGMYVGENKAASFVGAAYTSFKPAISFFISLYETNLVEFLI